MGGLAQLDYLRELVKRVDNDWDGVLADLYTISACLNNRAGSVTNLTADAKTLDLSMPSVEAFFAGVMGDATVPPAFSWAVDYASGTIRVTFDDDLPKTVAQWTGSTCSFEAPRRDFRRHRSPRRARSSAPSFAAIKIEATTSSRAAQSSIMATRRGS